MSKGMYLILQAIMMGLTILFIAWKLAGTDHYIVISPVLSGVTVMVLFTTMASWKAKTAKEIKAEKEASKE